MLILLKVFIHISPVTAGGITELRMYANCCHIDRCAHHLISSIDDCPTPVHRTSKFPMSLSWRKLGIKADFGPYSGLNGLLVCQANFFCGKRDESSALLVLVNFLRTRLCRPSGTVCVAIYGCLVFNRNLMSSSLSIFALDHAVWCSRPRTIVIATSKSSSQCVPLVSLTCSVTNAQPSNLRWPIKDDTNITNGVKAVRNHHAVVVTFIL